MVDGGIEVDIRRRRVWADGVGDAGSGRSRRHRIRADDTGCTLVAGLPVTSAALLGELGPEAAGRVLSLVDVALVVLDEDANILHLNDHARRMIGGGSSAILGEPLCPDRAGPEICDCLERVRQSGVEVTFEGASPLRRGPGTWCQVRCIPLTHGAALVVRDITAFRHSEELHRSIVETAADAIIVIDETGLIDSVNPAVERLFGWTASEIVGRNVSILMPEPFRSEHDAYLRRYLRDGVPRIIGSGRDVPARRKNGSTFPMHLAVAEMNVGARRMFTGIVSDLTESRRIEAELSRTELRSVVLAEQASLRRVATAVAGEADPAAIFDLVAKEAAGHLNADVGLVCRFDEDRSVIVGQWSSGPRISARSLPKWGGGALAQVARSRAPGRVDDYGYLGDDPVASVAAEFAASVAAPILSSDGVWGAVLASTTGTTPFPPEAEHRLAEFAELATMAVANAADRARLVALAGSDPLTGLTNHRVFHERLRGECRRAERHGRPLALVVLDLDHFKQINDVHGHATGDTVLVEIARRLLGELRDGELLARIGGEEFAWILPDTDIAGARDAAERARRAVVDTPFPRVGRVTISAGTCDLARAGDPEQLFLSADGALYRAKRQGRNMVCDYDDGERNSLSPGEHVARLERAQAVTGVRALAHAVDAKDPSTREHSTRVAEMATRMASVSGWSPDRIAHLHEAGILHDVGKIGVPDAVLFKRGPLTPDEYEIIKQHASLGEHIVAGIVTAEQAAWVRHHHERFDGRGYPDGLVGVAIPEGARILAVADAWDVMTSEHPCGERLVVEEALEECRRQVGLQFCPNAVDALERLWQSGALREG